MKKIIALLVVMVIMAGFSNFAVMAGNEVKDLEVEHTLIEIILTVSVGDKF